MMATYTVVRSAINSFEVGEECVDQFMCEGGVELRKHGEFGRLLVDMGGELLGERRKIGLERGIYGECYDVFEVCREVPYHYRYPGLSNGEYYHSQDYLIQVMWKMFNESIVNKD